MQIPFIAKVDNRADLGVEEARFRYIAETRGGSAFLLAGAVFWLGGSVWSAVVPDGRVVWVLYAGIGVPVLGFAIARLQGARLLSNPSYASLVVFATMTELAALPTMFFLHDSHPGALPAILMISDGAHLPILM